MATALFLAHARRHVRRLLVLVEHLFDEVGAALPTLVVEALVIVLLLLLVMMLVRVIAITITVRIKELLLALYAGWLLTASLTAIAVLLELLEVIKAIVATILHLTRIDSFAQMPRLAHLVNLGGRRLHLLLLL